MLQASLQFKKERFGDGWSAVALRNCWRLFESIIGCRGDLYTVGKLLGHTSINSTQVYADVVMETKIEASYKLK
ncbi:hypothetical protein [uncultured Bacteroides sp.]|uniref:hypothetical protein n=1 Tax=uncultured Bacteroides sp. TaxID=162156 RepID=UPI002636CBF3|nr:hypothetical protein [uncultured Bacteroides sp.]